MHKVSRRGGHDVGQRWPDYSAWTSHCIGLYPAVPTDSGARFIPAVLSAWRQYTIEGEQSEPTLALVQEIRLNAGLRGRETKGQNETGVK